MESLIDQRERTALANGSPRRSFDAFSSVLQFGASVRCLQFGAFIQVGGHTNAVGLEPAPGQVASGRRGRLPQSELRSLAKDQRRVNGGSRVEAGPVIGMTAQVERETAEIRWVSLCQQVGVTLAWPGRENAVFSPVQDGARD
ncbi:hypothetical protein ACFWP7_15225 [Streptomyces sp. NPDC058470]|uniref:hypothetical protein n=1 Tax=Streptomyces sp. NPDC058470 TaxID=3346515 RepID=UPI0036619707